MHRALGSTLLILFTSLAALPTSAQTTPEVPDAWSERVTLRSPSGWYPAPIHATLMPDGSVAVIGYERDVEDPTSTTANVRKAVYSIEPTPPGQPVPAEITVEVRIQPTDANNVFVDPLLVDDTLFCGGNTLTADGELFTVGGTRQVLDTSTGAFSALGLSYATLFDGVAWTRVAQDMKAVAGLGAPGRWYPTVVRLPDERLFVVSGLDVVLPFQSFNLSAEVFDPATADFEVVSGVGQVPLEVFNGDYTHAFVLPEPVRGHELVVFGQAGIPVLGSVPAPGGAASWAVLPSVRPGAAVGEIPNHGTSTVMLPLRLQSGEWGYANGSVLFAGGAHGSSHMRNLDLYDPVANAWAERIDGGVMRHHPNTVILPDGRLLVTAGHNKAGTAELRHNTYVDPRDGFSVRLGLAPSDEVRGYHSVSLLLPDGRVLIGGGQDLETGEQMEKTSLRYYSPDYLFARERPVIVQAPATLRYGESFVLRTVGLPVREVVLVSLGSMTHSFDSNQRHVELEIESPLATLYGIGSTAIVGAPKSRASAPSGYYMLFALDGRNVPSEARIVRLE